MRFFAEADVQFSMAKGEAEMKSSNAVAKVASAMSRVGHLSLLTFIVLSLVVASSSYAGANDEFRLCKKVSGDKVGPELDHLSSSESTDAVKWLRSDKNFKKFVESFRSQPFKFVEAFKAAMLDASKKGQLDKFVKEAIEKIEKLDKKVWGEDADTTKSGLMALLGAMKSMKPEQLNESDFLKKLFEKEKLQTLLDLGNCEKKEKKGKSIKEQIDEAVKGAMAEFARTQQVAQGQSAPPAGPQQDRMQELDDSAIQGIAQRVCDYLKAVRDAQIAANKAAEEKRKKELEPLKDMLAETLNALKARPRVPKEEKPKEDDLDKLLKALEPKDKPKAVTPSGGKEDGGGGGGQPEEGSKPQQPPEPPPPQEDKKQPEQPQMPQGSPSSPTQYQVPQVKSQIPDFFLGNLSSALQSRANELKKAAKEITENPFLSKLPWEDLMMKRHQLDAKKNAAQAELDAAKKRMKTVETAIQKYGKNPDLAIDSNIEEHELMLQGEVEKFKKAAEKAKKAKESAGQNMQAAFQAKQDEDKAEGQREAAEEALKELQKRRSKAKKDTKGELEGLVAQRDELQDSITALEGAIGDIEGASSAVASMASSQVNQIAQQGMAARGGTQNVLTGAQRAGGQTPRVAAPIQNGGLGAAAAGASGGTGNIQRGPLAQ